MKLVLQYFARCPNWQELEELVLAIMAERNDLELRTQAIATAEEAVEHEFHWSPTLLVDGNDPFASHDAEIGFYCRLYAAPSGLAGSPSIEQLRQALAQA
ncbi:thioredoxin family protein [Glutamicibacter arilaitensis]